MPDNSKWEDKTRRLLSEAISEQKAINEQTTKLQDKAVILEKEINAYELSLQNYSQRMKGINPNA